MPIPKHIFDPPFNIVRASHVVLGVRDLARSRAFYADTLGLHVEDAAGSHRDNVVWQGKWHLRRWVFHIRHFAKGHAFDAFRIWNVMQIVALFLAPESSRFAIAATDEKEEVSKTSHR